MPSFGPLAGDVTADVVVVGGGISGLTAALYLARAGERVVLLEARTLGERESGHTTAHLTEQLDATFVALERDFGPEGARAAAASSREAIDRIEALAREGDGCGFARVPLFVAAADDRQAADLERELAALRRAGADAGWADALPLPLRHVRAMRLERQGQVHAGAYLALLAARAAEAGARLFEGTRALEIEDGAPCRVHTPRGELRARDVLVLTDAPVSSRFAFHTVLRHFRTYAVAAGPVASPPPPALVYDMEEPYHYVRTQETADGTWLVVGGEDHEVGHGQREEDGEARWSRLGRLAGALGADAPVTDRWSGQVVEPADGLPYVGRSPLAAHVWTATGYSGTGFTFGTLAAAILADAVRGVESRWAPLYEARRVKPLASAREFLAHNADVALRYAKDRLDRGEGRFEDLAPGEGRLVRRGGRMLAASRDVSGRLHVRSAVCPHLGCHVQWNPAEASWDCPCHGSRFEATGAVLHGPSTRPLGEASPRAGAPGAEPRPPSGPAGPGGADVG